MPVGFLSPAQKRRYGEFDGEPSIEQLSKYFYLDERDRELIATKRTNPSRLGFALQLTCLRFVGRFPANLAAVPDTVVNFVAKQIGAAAADVTDYSNSQVVWRHQREIRRIFGYAEITTDAVGFRLTRYLYARAWTHDERPTVLFDLATSWLVRHKVLLPGSSTLERLVATLRERVASRIANAMAKGISEPTRSTILSLVEKPTGGRNSRLDELRRGPRTVSSTSLRAAFKRWSLVHAHAKKAPLDERIPAGRVRALARQGTTLIPAHLLRLPTERQLAILIAFLHRFDRSALDDAVDLFDILLTKLAGEARYRSQKERLRTIKEYDKAASLLRDSIRFLLESRDIDETFKRFPTTNLEKAAGVIDAVARPADEDYHKELIQAYGRLRNAIGPMLETLPMQATIAGAAALAAANTLIKNRTGPLPKDVPIGFLEWAWKRRVRDENGQVNRPAYAVAAMYALQDALRRRDVFVPGSERWGDPREKLMPPKTWSLQRSRICRALSQAVEGDDAIARLSGVVDALYREVADRMEIDEAIQFDGDRFSVEKLDEIPEPPGTEALRRSVAELMPKVDLPEVLLEVHAHTGFLDAFVHVTERKSRAVDLPTSIAAVLLSEACNIPKESVVREERLSLSRSRLGWVQQNYLRTETIRRANAALVDFHSELALPKKWGGGEVASADGMRFVTPLATINAGPNPKYFGLERGITYYNFSSDQYAGFHYIVIPGTLRDSLYILDGILEHETSLRPREIMTDTAGSSEMVFALFWLLGYQFSPRIADIGGTRFWRIDPDADYGALNRVSRHRVDCNLIRDSWDDLLRVAASLKTGLLSASELMRSLLQTKKPTTLAKALGELGKLTKTMYMLKFIDDESYRRRILTQLNRGESRHSVARAVCYGQKGEIRKRYREGQEDQLGALGLVVNAIVVWNTLYMTRALDHLRSEGMAIDDDQVARLSPLGFRHINILGRYSFDIPEVIASGQLRPIPTKDDGA